MFIHWTSVAIGSTQFIFYIALSTWLQYKYYIAKANCREEWKTQAKICHQIDGERAEEIANLWTNANTKRKTKLFDNNATNAATLWWKWMIVWDLPLISLLFPSLPEKSQRHPLHKYLATLNLLMSCGFATFTAEAYIRNWTNLYSVDGVEFFPSAALFARKPNEYGWVVLVIGTFASVVLECVCEYYWHRLQHTAWCYQVMHKYHHYYRQPEPFDDMFIHPCEAIGYYIQLYLPAILPIPLLSYLLYMSIMGLCGVIDHSGIRIHVPFVYDSEEHDEHHRLYYCNYSFPFPFMDKLHGTFRAPLSKKFQGVQPIHSAHGQKVN